MRAKIELVVSAILMIAIACSIAYSQPAANSICQGAYNCKLVNCYDASKEGYSCG